ncbi:uncharacterized protein DAT39_022166 [Clarias magur]|uniref:Uncharacterized protein n=1 Tax=Clarias magur TaxID=1594786 RepID=A0A8J4TDT9_CLAMG|nr:uncharacterized protein DAT39_022166 [Clarias magur]
MDVSLETKSAKVNAMEVNKSDDEPLVRVSVDLKTVHEKSLPYFVTSNTAKLFTSLQIPMDFLRTPPSTWNERLDFQEARERVKCLSVSNYNAECAVALIQDFNGHLTRDEEQLQYLLLVVAEHRKNFPDASKQTMMNTEKKK